MLVGLFRSDTPGVDLTQVSKLTCSYIHANVCCRNSLKENETDVISLTIGHVLSKTFANFQIKSFSLALKMWMICLSFQGHNFNIYIDGLIEPTHKLRSVQPEKI